ncbi:aminotransferase class III-fold pyridoxal phosphate-dependent enzyme, partial [Pseudodesulfovibrio sp.]|nr:aminotransferase class III-fold pyridoxal phosphate-dependent enzyme [Pseudodesulfovibrio sp.]
SLEMQERAGKRIPGMTQLLSKRPDLFSRGVWPGYYSRAKGAKIWDLDGNEFLDMSIGGIGANVLGYADPDVDAAVVAAIADGVSSSLNCPEEVELADLLCELHPWADMVRFARAGGEAMAMAVRIARARAGRDVVAFCGYHGWHDWYLAANVGADDALGDHLLSGLSPTGVPKGLKGTALPFRYNRIDELEAIVERNGDTLAAIVMEPIRNEEPEPGFFAAVRKIADEIGAVLIVDEISAGFRFLTGGAHLALFEQTPDMAVFSKGLGNGYSIAAVVGTQGVMQAAQDSFISSTNWTERVGPVAALTTIRKHREQNVVTHLNRLGERVQQGWKDAAQSAGIGIHVGGMKAMSHFTLEGEDALERKAFFVQAMLDRGILASNVFYVMYAHSDEDVDRYLDACGDIFAELAKIDDCRPLLRGAPAISGFQRIA